MNIGILGSGLMGGKLGTIFTRAGHNVVFSYSRHPEKLRDLAIAAGGKSRAGSPRETAEWADVILLAVNWPQINDVLAQAGELADRVVISCCLPMNADNTELAIGHTSSGAEELAKMIPRARVVSAFHTVPSEVLFDVFENRDQPDRPSILYSGDDIKSKKVAERLISDVGFEPIDVGPLRFARYTEPFTMVVAKLAYEGYKGPELAYRFEWFRR